MTPTPEMLSSVPFQYAGGVRSGSIVAGRRIKQAVERFYRWIDEAEEHGFYLDHQAGMRIINFFPLCLNHTVGKMAGQPFVLAPFQQFTMYNLFGWKVAATGLRRISTVYDRRGKKNGKTAEMAGLSLYMMAFDNEMGAKNYIGATKEDQARLCWEQAADFINSPVANPALRKMGFLAQQKGVGFPPTKSVMRPLGGDSKTQDGINAHLAIIDEYHAHADDGVKENLESSNVMRSQPVVYHITTAGTNLQSACKRYEDGVIEILEGRKEVDHIWIMIHEMDPDDDWNDEKNWVKANPLLGQGYDIDSLQKKYAAAVIQPSKFREFKTKNLNMWVDAPEVWIPMEIWDRNKHSLPKEEVLQKFRDFGGYAGVDLSSTRDITALVLLSNPDDEGKRYVVPFFFCPKDTIDYRSTEDKVPYRAWADAGLIYATEGNVVHYGLVQEEIYHTYQEYYIIRVGIDAWQAENTIQNLMDWNVSVSKVHQGVTTVSPPTKELERMIYNGEILHDGNPVLAWMLAGVKLKVDQNGNIRIDKGGSEKNSKRRIDGVAALINAVCEQMTGDVDANLSAYSDPDYEFEC